MNYQALQHLKTKSKLLKMCDSLQEAKQVIEEKGAIYQGRSYVGNFPTFSAGSKRFSIQGSINMGKDWSIVCSLPESELETLFNNQ